MLRAHLHWDGSVAVPTKTSQRMVRCHRIEVNTAIDYSPPLGGRSR